MSNDLVPVDTSPQNDLVPVSENGGILSPSEEHQARVSALAPMAEADIAKQKAATQATIGSRFSAPTPAGQGSVQSMNLADIPIAGPLIEKGLSSVAAAYPNSSFANYWAGGNDLGETEDERYRNSLAYQEAYREAQKKDNPTQYYGARAAAVLPQLALTPEIGVGRGIGWLASKSVAPVAEQMPGVVSGALNLLGRPAQGAAEAATWNAGQHAAESAPGSTAQDVGSNAKEGALEGFKTGYLVGLPLNAAIRTGKWATDATKALWNPEAYAAGEASRAYEGATANERAAKLSPEDAQRLASEGKPVSPLDIAGGKKLGNEAASTVTASDPDVIKINDQLTDRFNARSQNVQADIAAADNRPMNPTTGKPLTDQEIRSQADEHARQVNAPAYEAAYSQPQAQVIWNDDLQRLVNTPGGKAALNKTVGSSAVRATQEGQPITNPFYTDQNGQVQLNREAGEPGLEFWDRFKRNMNDVAESQKGEFGKATTESGETNSLLYGNPNNPNQFGLVPYLKKLVPEYDTALTGSRQFIREDNAFDAGKNFFNTANVAKNSKNPLEADGVLNEFGNTYSKGEQDTFRHGLLANITENPTQAAKVFAGADAKTLDRYRQVLGDDMFNNVDNTLRMHRIAAAGELLSAQAPQDKTNIGRSVAMGITGGGGLVGLAYNIGPIMNYATNHIAQSIAATAATAGVGTAVATKRAIDQAMVGKKAEAILKMMADGNPETFQRIAEAGKHDKQVDAALRAVEYGITRQLATQKDTRQFSDQLMQQGSNVMAHAAGGRIGRKSGGRTSSSAKAKADQLIAMVDRIKKEEGEGTKPLLNVDDTTIAKALEIANRGI